MPIDISPEGAADARRRLDSLAEEAGRDPRSIEITAFGVPADREVISEYERSGVNRVVVGLSTANRADSLAELDRIAAAVL